ncbi:MAG TPA: hypothetical protein VK157_01900 [Phycisphaerales bacterium]|nr:hypothetical protein [Phycisphaerales bacterium]
MALGGCSGTGWAQLGGASSGTTVQAIGDWNDLDAALEVSVPKVELALEHVELASDERGRTQRVWTLRGIRDESATVSATAGESGDDRELKRAGTIPITLNASVGRFGDSVREKKLLDMMKQRLGKLAGVDFAPLR